MRDDFLFVNADPSPSATPATRRRESARIRSYVQYSRRKAERAGRATSAGAQDEFTTDLTVRQDHSPSSSSQPSSAPSSAPTVMELPSVFPTNNSSDPFQCTVAGVDMGSAALLRINYEACASPNFCAESFAPATISLNGSMSRHEHIFRDRQRRCIDDPVLMYSTLAHGASLVAWMTGEQSPNGKSVDYFMSVALQKLRARLATLDQNEVDEWLLVSIWCLAVTELGSATPPLPPNDTGVVQQARRQRQYCLEASGMHMTTLWRLVEDAGGWNKFSPYIYDCGMLAAKYLSIIKGAPPIRCGTQDMNPPRLQQELPHDPQPHLAATLRPYISDEELRKTLDMFLNHVKLSEYIWNAGTIDPHSEMLIFRKHQEVAMRLQTHLGPQNGLHKFADMSDADSCVCLTLLVVHLNITSHLGPQAIASIPARRLQALLQNTPSHVHPDMRLWSLLSCAMSPVRFPERHWFVERIKEQNLSRFAEGGIEVMLESWFFLPSRQSEHLAELLRVLQNP